MPEKRETVATADGEMDVFIAYPDKGEGSFPVIIQLMDGIGMREELRDLARKTAAWGYYVVSPDLFYRDGLKGPLSFEEEEQRNKIMAAIGALTAEKATQDVLAALKLAEVDPVANADKIAIYGFCMGGKLTLELSQILGERVVAAAAIHPGNMCTDSPNSPHLHVDQISAEMYFGIADKDQMATPVQMAKLELALQAADIAYELEWHRGALHGFMMPSRAELYHEKAAQTVWGRIESLFARNLPPTA